jgi:AbrB family looped-hinge helix DNA binding protein
MVKSTITSKYQTTVPKEVRDRLCVGSGDVLVWEVVDHAVRVWPAGTTFLDRRGTVRVGSGSTAEDVRRARTLRGRESR